MPTRRQLAPVAIATLALLSNLATPADAWQSRQLDSEALAGLELRNIGPAAMSGRMVDVAVVESDPFTFYVATATGGLWKTTNNGVTFEPVFERQATHSIGDVDVSQSDPEVVWVGTGERANRQSSSWGDGVYRSRDGGETWENVGLRETRHIGRVVVHPSDPETAYVAALGHLWGANEERGVYRTHDGGANWERVLYGDADTGAVDVALDPEDPSIVYAATYQRRRTAYGFHGGGPGSGLYRSTDGGDTWSELTAGAADPEAEDNPEHPDGTLANGLPAGEYGRIGISIYRSDPRIVYASIEQGSRYTASTAYEGERYAGVYRSEDRGVTWRHMSDWNPRPMYASQILVDPSDDQRVYQQNSFSYSEDGGETWRVPRQSIHSDDRFLWVNPSDSRHLIKASDGALGISYDRGVTWLWASHLPVSQYYRISVDMAEPYNVYGGFQDNGSWVGPSATYRSEGILNEDWVSIGGGDGFASLVDPADPTVAYAESQYLGLTRLNLQTMERQSIRPGNPVGYKFGRRNWRLFGTGEEAGILEQEMEPGNWDGPYTLSPHDPSTIYAGTQSLYVSRDRGASWRDLGRMSNAWERSEVQIMGQDPSARVASLDDGVPYFATLTVIAESPLRPGLLYVGTDDGNVQVSRDSGDSFTNVGGRLPGLPERTWVADLEPSAHDESVVFAAFDGHRENDYTNYLYRSEDYGQTWRSIVGDMAAGRVLHAVHQDVVNPDLLFAATELGFFISNDGGSHWVELESNLPTVAVNEFVVHPRDHDLVLGTHGRGAWILDDASTLRELTPSVVASDTHLFSVRRASMVRRRRTGARTGDMAFHGANPPVGAILDYWLGTALEVGQDEESPVKLEVLDASGSIVRGLAASTDRGVNRVVWDLRHESLAAPARIPRPRDPALVEQRDAGGGGGFGGFGGGPPSGPLVVPGNYTVRLTVGAAIHERSVEVSEDPRIRVAPQVRRSWTAIQLELGGSYAQLNDMVGALIERQEALEEEELPEDDARLAQTVRLREECEELRSRVLSVRGAIAAWTGPWTGDQRSQIRYYQWAKEDLVRRLGELADLP